jgi:P-loop Domain of unknown function (DUF2791)
MSSPIRRRDRESLLNALRMGVPPSRGFQHVQVGRADEVEALANDIRLIKDGGSATRFIVGSYGSGKTFFLQVIRNAAQNAGCLTMHADITQYSRLSGTGGKVRALVSALVASAGTKGQPEGGALEEVLDRFVAVCEERAHTEHREVKWVARDALASLTGFTRGFDFVAVVLVYLQATRESDSAKRSACMQWFRAEYRLNGEAKAALGINSIVTDADLYPLLRLFAVLARRAGFSGLIVEIDEMGVLDGHARQVRDANYEQLLTMINDLHSGRPEGLEIVFAGTPEFVVNPVRGLFSYPALKSRLAPNEFARPGMVNTAGPVILLTPVTGEDLMVLMENVHRIYCSNGQRDPLPEGDSRPFTGFLDHCAEQLGGFEYVSAKRASQQFLQFLDILDQNRKSDWRGVLDQLEPALDLAPASVVDEELDSILAAGESEPANDLADFQL